MKQFNLVVLKNCTDDTLRETIQDQLPGLPPKKADKLFLEIIRFRENKYYAQLNEWTVNLKYMNVVITETTETKTVYDYTLHNTYIEESITRLPKTTDRSVRRYDLLNKYLEPDLRTNEEQPVKPEPPPLQYIKESYSPFKSDDK